MIALEGRVQGNKIVIENDISAYNGNAVIVTILDKPSSHRRRNIDLDSYSKRTDRGQNVDEYMQETRDNDRI